MIGSFETRTYHIPCDNLFSGSIFATDDLHYLIITYKIVSDFWVLDPFIYSLKLSGLICSSSGHGPQAVTNVRSVLSGIPRTPNCRNQEERDGREKPELVTAPDEEVGTVTDCNFLTLTKRATHSLVSYSGTTLSGRYKRGSHPRNKKHQSPPNRALSLHRLLDRSPTRAEDSFMSTSDGCRSLQRIEAS